MDSDTIDQHRKYKKRSIIGGNKAFDLESLLRKCLKIGSAGSSRKLIRKAEPQTRIPDLLNQNRHSCAIPK